MYGSETLLKAQDAVSADVPDMPTRCPATNLRVELTLYFKKKSEC